MKFQTMRKFSEWMEAMGRGSTMTAYQRALIRFSEWLEAEEIKPLVATHEDLLRFQRYLAEDYRKPNGDPLVKGTQSTWLAGVKSYYKYLFKSNRIAFDPARKIKLPKIVKKTLSCDLLTQQETIAYVQTQAGILRSKSEGSFFWAIEFRNLAMLCLGLATGRRCSSLRALRVKDLDPKRLEVRIDWEKGNPGRVLPVSQWAMDSAIGYVEKARPVLLAIQDREDHEWLFTGVRTERICKEYLSRLVQSLQPKVAEENPDLEGLEDKKLSSHSLRVTFATSLMFLNGAGIRVVNELLLHKQLSTSAKYTPIETDDLRIAMRNAIPVV